MTPSHKTNSRAEGRAPIDALNKFRALLILL
jgi:hypothetical protein